MESKGFHLNMTKIKSMAVGKLFLSAVCCTGLGEHSAILYSPFKEVEVGYCVLEVVDHFCYLGDMLNVNGGYEASAIALCMYCTPRVNF